MSPLPVLDRAVAGLREARSRVMTPSRDDVDPDVRGFAAWAQGPSIVPLVGNAFLDGFEIGSREPTAAAILALVEDSPAFDRGFVAEGAAMAAGLRARLEPWNRGILTDLLSLGGNRHGYLMYVGMGWSLARLPRPLWPHLDGLDGSIAALVLDGYGFHQVFFHTESVLEEGETGFPVQSWPGGPEVARHQLAQGIGRALWFVCGGSETRVRDSVVALDPRVHASLWAGVGLAMAYAGGRPADGMRAVLDAAGDHGRWVRQGAAFAVEARVRADVVLDHTRVASDVLCGQPVERVVEVVLADRPSDGLGTAAGTAAYEVWRARVASALDHG